MRQERALACWGDTKARVPETCRPKGVQEAARKPGRGQITKGHGHGEELRFDLWQWEEATGAAQPTRSQMEAT